MLIDGTSIFCRVFLMAFLFCLRLCIFGITLTGLFFNQGLDSFLVLANLHVARWLELVGLSAVIVWFEAWRLSFR